MSLSSLLRQKDFKFKASLGYTVNYVKNKTNKNKKYLLFDGLVLLNPILYIFILFVFSTRALVSVQS